MPHRAWLREKIEGPHVTGNEDQVVAVAAA